MITIDALFSSRPTTMADAFAKVKDANGMNHGSDGRFTAGEGSAAAKEDAGLEEATARHTDADGHLNGDAMVRERHDAGQFPETETNERHAVFMIGGGGSGKGGYVTDWAGNEGEKDKAGKTIERGHPQFRPARPGFHSSRVIDPDAEKKKVPGFSPKNPSGPQDDAALDAIPAGEPGSRHSLDAYIAENTPFTDVEDFAAQRDLSEGGTQPKFGGGLTHEISSYVAKEKLRQMRTDPNGQSFVYDSTGSKDYESHAKDALAAGYRVTFHHVDTPEHIAMMRNSQRARTVPEKLLRGTHAKVRGIVPGLHRFAHEMNHAGLPITWQHDRPWNGADDRAARDGGWHVKAYGEGGEAPLNHYDSPEAKDVVRQRALAVV